MKNKILLWDALEILKKIPNESFDLIIADPPYNLNKDFWVTKEDRKTKEDRFEWSKLRIKECNRVLKPNWSIFIYGIHHYIGFIQCYLYDLWLNYWRLFIWNYENWWSKYKRYPASTYEPLLRFTKWNKYTYHMIREPYKSTERLKSKIIKNGKTRSPNPEWKHGWDIRRIPTLAWKAFENEKVDHPTQKPIAICDKIVKHFSNEGDSILIPFSWSWSEIVSCIKNKRSYTWIEINPEYIKITKERIKNTNWLN